MSKVIGEGTYGCVHRPSLHCAQEPSPDFDYSKYVSKIMLTKNAQDELAEFVTIGKLDTTDEYHLGTPYLCKTDLKKNDSIKAVSGCKNINVKDVENNPNKYSLLVLPFGGPDFKSFCVDHIKKYMTSKKKEKCDEFWLEVYHLLKGLQFFRKHDIVHNDLKPQNILFNMDTQKMKYIDFGLMRKKIQIIKTSKASENFMGIFHWSYPFECGFMNKTYYNKYVNLSVEEREKYKDHFIDMIVTNPAKYSKDENTGSIPISRPESFKILFTYLNPNGLEPDTATQIGYITSFFDGFNKMIDKKSYEQVLEFITNSIDVFGLGMSLQYITNCFYRHKLLSIEHFGALTNFFNRMYDFNPLNRLINTGELIEEYENILLEMGVLIRLHKNFKNGNLISESPVPTSLLLEQYKHEKAKPKSLSTKLSEFANEDIVSLSQSKKNKSLTNTKKWHYKKRNNTRKKYNNSMTNSYKPITMNSYKPQFSDITSTDDLLQ
uniref:Protein kinase domain-containing protein n=1 Tax=viral metagenome TaxID=1070528 RepID=A0A6C0IS67_9ZZZZ